MLGRDRFTFSDPKSLVNKRCWNVRNGLERIDSRLLILILGNQKIRVSCSLRIVKQKTLERKHVERKIRIFFLRWLTKDVDSCKFCPQELLNKRRWNVSILRGRFTISNAWKSKDSRFLSPKVAKQKTRIDSRLSQRLEIKRRRFFRLLSPTVEKQKT